MRRRHEQDLVFALLALAPLLGAIALVILSALLHQLRRRAADRGEAQRPAREPLLALVLDRLAHRIERLDPQARFWGPAAAGMLIGLAWSLIHG